MLEKIGTLVFERSARYLINRPEKAYPPCDAMVARRRRHEGGVRVTHIVDDDAVGGIRTVLDSFMHSCLTTTGDHKIVWMKPARRLFIDSQADILVLHYACSWRRLMVTLLLRILNPNARMFLHEHHYSATVDQRVPNRARFHRMLRLTYRMMDTVVAVSRSQSDWLCAQRLVPRKKLRVINPCRKLDRFLEVPPPELGRPLVFGAYGRLNKQKGFDILVQAMLGLSPARFRLLVGGSGPESLALSQLAEGLPHVEFVGTVTDVPKFLVCCDVIVVPSRYEPFGLVCLEAKAAGRPVIVSDVDGLPEQVGNCGLIVPPCDVVALATALRSLREKPLSIWGANGRAATLTLWGDYQAAWSELLYSEYA